LRRPYYSKAKVRHSELYAVGHGGRIVPFEVHFGDVIEVVLQRFRQPALFGRGLVAGIAAEELVGALPRQQHRYPSRRAFSASMNRGSAMDTLTGSALSTAYSTWGSASSTSRSSNS